MSTMWMRTIVASLLATLPPLAARAEAQERVRLDQVMSREERTATGLARLNARERAALEAWLARYTATVTAAMRSMEQPVGDAATDEARRPTPARSERSERADRDESQFRSPAGYGSQIYRSVEGGTFVMLGDGTMWEIYLPDRPNTVGWKGGDAVLVRRRPAAIGDYEYMLVNGARNGTAAARFAGRVRVPDER